MEFTPAQGWSLLSTQWSSCATGIIQSSTLQSFMDVEQKSVIKLMLTVCVCFKLWVQTVNNLKFMMFKIKVSVDGKL